MEVAALGLKVEGVEGIDRAAASLDGLAAAGVKAEKSTQGVGKGSSSAKPSVDALAASADKAAQAEARLAAQAERAGMSVGAMKAALRGVPAQFTDIATSLQGGMSPLTVFLQQGGQLKDMFGGAGSAARALGGYVLGLVNPFTVAAAGAAALGLAYFQGSKEQDAFMVSMAKTGNSAGVTTSSLKAYAEQISATSGTQGKAAESLNIFIESGVKAGTGLARLTETAIAWEKATGEGVDKVAAKYVALQNDPLKAAMKLNEGMNFLTLSVYEQVKSLEEQGKTTEAAKVAMDALDSAMAERSKTIEQNLGSIQRGWNGITGAAKKAWDAMLNIGRPSSLNDQLLEVDKQLERLMGQQGFGETEGGAATGRVTAGQQAKIRESVRLLQEQRAALMGQAEAERWSADATKKNSEALAAKSAWDKIVTSNLSKQEKMEIALANVRQRAADAGVTGKALEAQLSAEREKYADKTKKSTAAVTVAKTAYESLIVSINEKIAATNSELASGDKQTEADKLRARYQQELTTRSRQFTDAQKKKIEADIAAYDVLEKQLKAARELEKAWADDEKALESYTKKQDDYLRSVSDSVAKMQEEEAGHILAAQAGISHAQAMQQLTIARLEDARAQMQQGAGSAEEIDRINQEIEARKKLLGVIQAGDARKETEKATEDAAKAWQKSLDDAQKAAEKTSQMIGDTLSDYIMGGGKDAATYLKRLFANLVLQPVVQYGVNALMSAVGLGGAAQSGGGAGALGGLLSGGKLALGAIKGSTGTAAMGASGVATTGGVATSAMSYVPYVAAIMAGMNMSGKAYDEGYRLGHADYAKMWALTGGIAPPTISLDTKLLESLGISGKTANMITGAALWAKAGAKLGLVATPHTGAGAIYQGGSLQEGQGIYGKSVFGMGDPKEYAESAQNAVSSVATQIGVTLDGVAMAFGKKAGFSVATAFADDISKDGSWGSLKITDSLGKVLLDWTSNQTREGVPREFGNGAEGYEEFVRAAQADMLSAIQQMDIAGWAKDMFGDATVDTLADTMKSVAMVMAQFSELGKTMKAFSGIGEEMQTTLINASGSMDALTSNAQNFYQGFFSEEERFQKQRELQMSQLSGMGLYIDPYQGNAAKDSFRKTVEEAMSSGQAEMAAQLLAMSGAFASTADYAQQSADEIIQTAKAAAEESERLMQGFYQSFFSEQERALAQRSEQMSQLSAMGLYIDPAEGDKAKELFRKTVEEALATGQTELANKLLMMGDAFAATAGYAQQFIDQLKESAKAAAQEAAQSMAKAWSSFTTVAGLAAQYNGNTSGLTAQLGVVRGSYANATTTEGRVGALQQIISLEQGLFNAQEEARQAEAQAATARANAAREQLNSANQLLGAAKGLGDYVKQLRFSEASGLSEAQRATALQKEYNSLLGRARSGDINAMQDLQSVSSNYLTLAEQMSGTQQDYTAISTRMAAELAATAAIQEAAASSQVARLEQQIAFAESTAASVAAQFKVSEATQKLIDDLLVESATAFEAESTLTQKLIDQGAVANDALASLPAELAGAIGTTLLPAIRDIAYVMAQAAGIDGSHAGGLASVPFNGYRAILHKDEAVLTAEENRAYRSGASSGSTTSVSNEVLSVLLGIKNDNRLMAEQGLSLQLRIARRLDDWNGNGLPETREETA